VGWEVACFDELIEMKEGRREGWWVVEIGALMMALRYNVMARGGMEQENKNDSVHQPYHDSLPESSTLYCKQEKIRRENKSYLLNIFIRRGISISHTLPYFHETKPNVPDRRTQIQTSQINDLPLTKPWSYRMA
jgi:hypothetical protein